MIRCAGTRRWIIRWQATTEALTSEALASEALTSEALTSEALTTEALTTDWLILVTTTILPGAQHMQWTILCIGDLHTWQLILSTAPFADLICTLTSQTDATGLAPCG